MANARNILGIVHAAPLAACIAFGACTDPAKTHQAVNPTAMVNAASTSISTAISSLCTTTNMPAITIRFLAWLLIIRLAFGPLVKKLLDQKFKLGLLRTNATQRQVDRYHRRERTTVNNKVLATRLILVSYSMIFTSLQLQNTRMLARPRADARWLDKVLHIPYDALVRHGFGAMTAVSLTTLLFDVVGVGIGLIVLEPVVFGAMWLSNYRDRYRRRWAPWVERKDAGRKQPKGEKRRHGVVQGASKQLARKRGKG